MAKQRGIPNRIVATVDRMAGQGGKTTTFHMIFMAVLGIPACAAAWSNDEEERRKALLAYFSAGLPALVWDNIARGATISCPHIEKALTNEFYSDRVLGVSEFRLVLSSTIMCFTGNNISARGDMASRVLSVRLADNRPDPENREFKHPDPLKWTEDHRGQILAAMFTIMLGNPRRQPGNHPAPETRFKLWWEVIGSAIENAADEHARSENKDTKTPVLSFRTIFLDNEGDDEQASSLVTVLDILRRRYPSEELFQASEVAEYTSRAEMEPIAFKAALEMASGKAIKITSAPTINWRLQSLTDAPAKIGEYIFVLQYVKPDKNGRYGGFRVVQLKQ